VLVAVGGCGDDDDGTPEATPPSLPGVGVDETLPVLAEPPDTIGVPGDGGVEYAGPSTCSGVQAMFPLLDDEVGAALVAGDGQWVWVGLDVASASADVYSATAPDATLIQIRDRAIATDEVVAGGHGPVLTGETFAVTVTESADSLGTCEEVPAAEALATAP
jgi:hypothetical protein